jgi:SAM-dependent methyltransferase
MDEIRNIDDFVKLYKNDFFSIYPESFYGKMAKNRNWQVTLGELVAKMYNICSVVDFGCGSGFYLEGFRKGGASKVMGFERSYENTKKYIPENVLENISCRDVTEKIECGKFDLAMSIEVAEHIPSEKSEILVSNIVNASDKYILFTAAAPGRGGLCHINERDIGFWIQLFQDKGFRFSQKDTNDIRAKTDMIPFSSKYFSFIRKQIRFFVRA